MPQKAGDDRRGAPLRRVAPWPARKLARSLLDIWEVMAEVSELADMLRERARAALPKVEGKVRLPGLEEPVEVLRDRWGVPHIYARNTHDLYFAQGYVLASERLFQIEFMLPL